MTPDTAPPFPREAPVISLPEANYDIVGSIVIHECAQSELELSIQQFLEASTRYRLNTHLCIIDNSSRPHNFSQQSDPRISYFFAAGNLGYGRAHNIAIRAAHSRSKYSLIMNTDILYSPDVIERLKAILDSQPKAALVAPKIRYPDGALQYVCRLLPTPTNVFLRRFLPTSTWTTRADHRYELRWWDHNNVANIPFLQGSFLLLRTDICNAIGGFDERFFLYAEDIDLCRRLHQIAETLYVPDVSITHEYRRHNKHTLLGTWHAIYSHFQYFNKWGWFNDCSRRLINQDTERRLQCR